MYKQEIITALRINVTMNDTAIIELIRSFDYPFAAYATLQSLVQDGTVICETIREQGYEYGKALGGVYCLKG